MSRDWIVETETFLKQKYDSLRVEGPPLKIHPPLAGSEAEFFMRGWEEGLFSIDEECYVHTEMLRRPIRKGKKNKTFQLFWKGRDGHRFLFREGICQLSTVTSLVRKYGWAADRITLEPEGPEFRDLKNGVDILIADGKGGYLVCCEVKQSDSELKQLLKELRLCSSIGEHQGDECRHENHRKFAFISKYKPNYFFVTAPGTELCFTVTAQNDHVVLGKESQGLLFRRD